MDRDSTTRTGAKDPWGREGRPPAQRHVEASTVLDTEPGLLVWRKRAKGRSKLRGSDRMPGAGLRLRACRKALSDMLALKPYWGKPAVRNFRGGDGNVGIIRSPVRAIALLDQKSRGTPSGARAEVLEFNVQSSMLKVRKEMECVAVGTALAGGPPHGSGRAELPHPALALGNNATAHQRMRMITPLTPFTAGCLTYPLKRAGHAAPALSPGHVTLGRLPLGQSPSLHRLLGLRPSLVRRLLGYYGTVRLPVPVHHRCTSLDFPMRSALRSPTDRHGISRLPLKVLACMLRVSDRAGSKGVSRLRRLQSCLPLSSTASAPQSGHRLRDGGSISRFHTWPVCTPVNASLAPLRTKMHDSESARVASPSLYESFIHNTLPAFTGASEL